MLTGNVNADYEEVSSAWFAEVSELDSDANFIGPLAANAMFGGERQSSTDVSKWVIRLTPDATRQANNVEGAAMIVNNASYSLTVVRGLGLPGQLLVHADASNDDTVRAALEDNPRVATFQKDFYFFGQLIPDDPDFPSQTGLHNVGQFESTPDADINAPGAWDETTGSTNVVVGVIDSGIDVTHADLYLNIWINQGEIRPELKEALDSSIDGEERITFYDLNNCQVDVSPLVCHWTSGPNSALLNDLNENGYIDAQDLLLDPNWADGIDTDGNAFVDDFFGWNFRSGQDEPFSPNDPRDELGHGTHVAGTIGAIGNNSRGITGINWRSSLMSLKILDVTNRGSLVAATEAVNYATMMRTKYGEPVRVLNASWGQSGGNDTGLKSEIDATGRAGILFVAAAGNGNILGQGINLDREPFFPASYDAENVVSVAASDSNDKLARFSNFGVSSVDLVAPGIGVLSTLPGGRYGNANGTSMATPHVSGSAALAWSLLPEASLAEVRQAIMETAGCSAIDVAACTVISNKTAWGGRLDARAAMDSNVFAPRATLMKADNISAAGGTEALVEVQFQDRRGIDATTLGDGDIIATRQWGPRHEITSTLVADSIHVSDGGQKVTATYRIAAPGGTWDALDYGRYLLSAAPRQIADQNGQFVPTDWFGEFTVRIENDPTVFYVNSLTDAVDNEIGDGICADANDGCSLRAAIQEGNAAAPAERTIILDVGRHTLSIPPVVDEQVLFVTPRAGCGAPSPPAWSGEDTGDLDVLGNLMIIGDDDETSIVDARGIDRVFKVHPDATLRLERIGVTGGQAPTGQDGGGVLSAGTVDLDLSTVSDNSTLGNGGGIAVWDGDVYATRSTVWQNDAAGGGGLFVCNGGSLNVTESTIARNKSPNGGGGVLSWYGGPVELVNSTISENDTDRATSAALAFHPWEEMSLWPADGSTEPSISADGRFVAFVSDAPNLVPGDTEDHTDIFVFDRQSQIVDRVSINSDGLQANASSKSPSISSDGRFVAFESNASNLVPQDTNNARDIFVYDREDRTVERVSIASDGTQGNARSKSPSISADGMFVAFESDASNLVAKDENGYTDIFVFDRQARAVERVSIASDGTEASGFLAESTSASVSADGRFVAFESLAANLVPDDTVVSLDIFVYDRGNKTIERVSIADDGTQGDGPSSNPIISADGRFVAFESQASNLVTDDSNGIQDIFVYDRQNQIIERVSVPNDRSQANGSSALPSISGDGRFVAFESIATNLATGDVKDNWDTFVYDRFDQIVKPVSVASGSQGEEVRSESRSASLSADGRFVAFSSDSSQLVQGDTNRIADIFVSDLQSSILERIRARTHSVSLENVTIANNRGSEKTVFGKISIHNSLLAGNSSTSDLSGATESLGYNLVASSDHNVALLPTDRVIPNAADWLGPLQDNGGPNWTHQILPGSPALDAGDPDSSSANDQRGVHRPHDGDGIRGRQPDIGAFEVFQGEIHGTVFRDLNRNGILDFNEPALSNQNVFLDVNQDGNFQFDDFLQRTRRDDPCTAAVNEQGTYSFHGVLPGISWIVPLVEPGWSRSDKVVERVSIGSDGTEGNAGSFAPFISSNGRFVAFESDSSNLVLRDTNNRTDIFVYDRQNKSVERVSIAHDGTEGNENSYSPALTADGRFVAFESDSSNLVPGDTNDSTDVFIYDRQNRSVERVSIANDGTEGNHGSYSPMLSADGRFVAYSSDASNLVPGDTALAEDIDEGRDIFVYDRHNETVERVSIASDGTEANDGSYSPALSADGRFVAFSSDSSNLLPDATDESDVFVYDRQNNNLEIVSLPSESSESPRLSADGRLVVFSLQDPSLVPGDTNDERDIFVYDRLEQILERISNGNHGNQANGNSYSPSVSANGRFVAFMSEAANLVPEDSGRMSDIFISDRKSQAVQRVSMATDGTEADAGSTLPELSADGRFVAFQSNATNLVPGDTNGATDIFVRLNGNAVGATSRSINLHAGQVVTGIDLVLYQTLVRSGEAALMTSSQTVSETKRNKHDQIAPCSWTQTQTEYATSRK